ncbi:hypothetical protein [Pseudomonas capsici]|uniref:hypothetical protein n=1 Tax=Pseudomonas capsici TaxID=2810614 RepID=UPI0021F0D689|nr:hypothetical protein [Pseudomonas capsici]MCV4265033.1 hypothetical protein [Pseudomonas capsici]
MHEQRKFHDTHLGSIVVPQQAGADIFWYAARLCGDVAQPCGGGEARFVLWYTVILYVQVFFGEEEITVRLPLRRAQAMVLAAVANDQNWFRGVTRSRNRKTAKVEKQLLI